LILSFVSKNKNPKQNLFPKIRIQNKIANTETGNKIHFSKTRIQNKIPFQVILL